MGGQVLLALAIPWLLLGGGSAAITMRFLATSDRAEAEVLSSVEHAGSRGGATWQTTFALPTPDGTRLVARWRGEIRFVVGEAVPVRYRRTPFLRIQPENAWALWGWAWVLAGAGGAHLLGGSVVLPAEVVARHR